MMKILFVSLFLISTNSFAVETTSICPVLSDTLAPDFTDERHLVVRYRVGGTRSYFDSLHLIKRDEETEQEDVEELFAQSKRGGYDVRYCNPDDREYLDSTKKFSWYSICTAPSPFQRINTRVSLSKLAEGLVKVRAMREDFTSEQREIVTGPCQ